MRALPPEAAIAAPADCLPPQRCRWVLTVLGGLIRTIACGDTAGPGSSALQLQLHVIRKTAHETLPSNFQCRRPLFIESLPAHRRGCCRRRRGRAPTLWRRRCCSSTPSTAPSRLPPPAAPPRSGRVRPVSRGRRAAAAKQWAARVAPLARLAFLRRRPPLGGRVVRVRTLRKRAFW